MNMEDVARACGVSRTTVSRVLNGSNKVKESTRRRVLRAIEALNYRPNLAAQSLKGGRSYFIGVIMDNITEETSQMIRVAEEICRGRGYKIALCIAGNSQEVARLWIEQNTYLEGVLFLRAGIQHSAWNAPEHIPSIYGYCLPPGDTVNCVYPDNVQGAYEATRHLIELGHSRIAYINGPADWEAHTTRLNGYLQALMEERITRDDALVVDADGAYESGYEIGRRLLRAVNRPTAIFACNDRMAVGAMHAALECGFAVPDDVSIVGYEDREFGRYTTPPLTTVRLPFREVAELATERLLGNIEGERTKVWPLTKVGCGLVKRSSTAPPG